MSARWWSSSKHAWKQLSEMHDRELLNSYRKLERSEYMGPEGDGIGHDEKFALEVAFADEFARRDMDPDHPTGRVEPPLPEA